MTTLKRIYKKYQADFEELEKRLPIRAAENPFKYEQWVGMGWTADRSGEGSIFDEEISKDLLNAY